MLLTNKTAIVFGGSGHIGGMIAKTLFSEGANTVIHSYRNWERAQSLASELDPGGRKTKAVCADVQDQSALENIVRDTVERFGSLDIAVNTVHAPFEPKNIANMEMADWNVHLDALRGQFLTSQAVLPVMRLQKSGRIIFLSAALSVRYAAGCSAYTTVKRGLNGFCRTLALEEGKNGILVNIVAPGGVSDGISEEGEDWDEMTQTMLKNCALGRFATLQEVANTVLYFASPLAQGVTGQTLYVTGGEIML